MDFANAKKKSLCFYQALSDCRTVRHLILLLFLILFCFDFPSVIGLLQYGVVFFGLFFAVSSIRRVGLEYGLHVDIEHS